MAMLVRTCRRPRLAARLAVRLAAGAVAGLLGAGLALLLSGLIGQLQTNWGSTTCGPAVLTAALICLGFGAMVPVRLAQIISRRPQRPQHHRSLLGDESLLWTATALVSLLAGLAVIVIRFAAPAADRAGLELTRRFLWPNSLLIIPQSLTALVLLALPLLAIGVALTCSHRLAAQEERWSLSSFGWLLIGLSAGAAISWLLRQSGVPTQAVAAAGAVPILAVSPLAIRYASRSEQSAPQPHGGATPPAPDVRDQWPLLTRLAVAWLAAATAALLLVWLQVPQRWPALSQSALSGRLAVLLLAAGAGLLVCHLTRPWRAHSVGGFGLACAACGLGSAITAVLPALWQASSGGPLTGLLAINAGSCIAALLLGYALGYGQLTVLTRVGSRPATGASILAMICWMAAGVIVVLGVDLPGPRTAFVRLAAVALSLLALGGIMIIHEPAYSPRTRRNRLIAVFASIALLMYLLPIAGRHWGPAPSPSRGSTATTAVATQPRLSPFLCPKISSFSLPRAARLGSRPYLR